MRWPFSKARPSGPERAAPAEAQANVKDKHFYRNYPQNATPRSPTPNRTATPQPVDAGANRDRSSSVRKRRRSPELPQQLDNTLPERATSRLRRTASQRNSEELTALPDTRRLDRSPHLRKSVRRSNKPDSRSVSRLSNVPVPDMPTDEATGKERSKSLSQKRRLSKRDEHRAKALREDQVRAMSTPPPPPKRISANGDLLNRENKKARRTFSSRTEPDDQRASNVSLPFQESIHSSMSGVSDKRGWEIPGLAVLRPRPSVRVANSVPPTSGSHGAAPSRTGSRRDKEKLPVVPEGTKSEKRRRVAELADDFNSNDLRVLLERDTRRADRRRMQDQEKLQAKLKRRADRARREEVERATSQATPPTAIHPALREATPVHQSSSLGQAPPTPTSDIERATKRTIVDDAERHDSAAVRQDPFSDPSPLPSPTPDPYRLQDPLDSALPTPSDVHEDPIISTAQTQEMRYSHGRLSQVTPTPPLSPVQSQIQRTVSPLRAEYHPQPDTVQSQHFLKHSFSTLTKKPSTWASIFRRSTTSRSTDALPPPPPLPAAISNNSLTSDATSSTPAHLMGSTSRRLSGTPRRTQSIFREDLPEYLNSPVSRGASPDVLAAGNVAAARRSKTGAAAASKTLPPLPDAARPGSSAGTDGPTSELGVSASLASIDSEGSWLTGRPSKRRSNQSHMRNSIGSTKRREGENNSYEDLGIPDEEHVRRLTPSPEDNEQESIVESNVTQEGNPFLHRETSQRRPNVVLRGQTAHSSHGLMADVHGGETPLEGSIRGSLHNSVDSGSDYSPEASIAGPPKVIYGQAQGHARHISSGSAKLLDIKARSPRTSVVSTSDMTPVSTR